MAEPERITPQQAYEIVKSGKAVLVCAYDDEEKCKKLGLGGAMSLNAFQAKTPAKDREIMFYCA
jgi:hypothetical protein